MMSKAAKKRFEMVLNDFDYYAPYLKEHVEKLIRVLMLERYLSENPDIIMTNDVKTQRRIQHKIDKLLSESFWRFETVSMN